MKNSAMAQSNPFGAALIVLGIVVGAALWMWGFKMLFAKMAGWKNLAEEFPTTELERPGENFKRMSGWIGGTEFERSFAIQIVPEGLFIRPSFAARSPILIPWLKISEVSATEERVFGCEQNILLNVFWIKSLEFSLPPKVLPLIRQHVSADRFSKMKIPPTSLRELLKDGLKKQKGG